MKTKDIIKEWIEELKLIIRRRRINNIIYNVNNKNIVDKNISNILKNKNK